MSREVRFTGVFTDVVPIPSQAARSRVGPDTSTGAAQGYGLRGTFDKGLEKS
jgi:hypothetical protein